MNRGERFVQVMLGMSVRDPDFGLLLVQNLHDKNLGSIAEYRARAFNVKIATLSFSRAMVLCVAMIPTWNDKCLN